MNEVSVKNDNLGGSVFIEEVDEGMLVCGIKIGFSFLSVKKSLSIGSSE